MGKKKTILTEDLFNANGNSNISNEILNEEVKNDEVVEHVSEEINDETNTLEEITKMENEKPISSVSKKFGFNDESYYYNN